MSNGVTNKLYLLRHSTFIHCCSVVPWAPLYPPTHQVTQSWEHGMRDISLTIAYVGLRPVVKYNIYVMGHKWASKRSMCTVSVFYDVSPLQLWKRVCKTEVESAKGFGRRQGKARFDFFKIFRGRPQIQVNVNYASETVGGVDYTQP